eukprot:1224672-Amphidinium_carterae.1
MPTLYCKVEERKEQVPKSNDGGFKDMFTWKWSPVLSPSACLLYNPVLYDINTPFADNASDSGNAYSKFF